MPIIATSGKAKLLSSFCSTKQNIIDTIIVRAYTGSFLTKLLQIWLYGAQNSVILINPLVKLKTLVL